MKKLLISIDWFEPGYKGGGPIRSCANLIDNLKKEYEIFVLTRDRDFGDDKPYLNIKFNQWLNKKEDYKIMYLTPNQQKLKKINSIINGVKPDFIYLNSMYSLYYTIFPLLGAWRNKINSKIILAPRGMLRSSAIQFKSKKKKGFIYSLKKLGVFKKIFFHATDGQEKEDIKKWINPPENKITVTKNFPPTVLKKHKYIEKQKGELKLVFIARILNVKNTLFALETIRDANLKGRIHFTICGPIEDKEYWSKCQAVIKSMPENISVIYKGELQHHEVAKVLNDHHVYFLPTLGENFGHSIFESFTVGRPVIISDQTPWRNLTAKKIGFDGDLKNRDSFIQAINSFIEMDQTEFEKWSDSTWNFAKSFSENSGLKADYLKMFST